MSMQGLCKIDRGVAMRRVPSLNDGDQWTTLCSVLLDRCRKRQTTADLDRVGKFTENKQLFRDLRTRNEAEQFGNEAEDRKELVNRGAF